MQGNVAKELALPPDILKSPISLNKIGVKFHGLGRIFALNKRCFVDLPISVATFELLWQDDTSKITINWYNFEHRHEASRTFF